MARKGVFNAFPSASSVGIGLKEYGNLSSSYPDKVVDKSLRFVLIRGTQVKDKIGVGRLPLRLGSGQGEKEIHAFLPVVLQQRQHSRNRGCADIIHQQKDIVIIDELDGVPNGGRGIVSVIVGTNHDLPAVDAPHSIDWLKISHGTSIELDTEGS